MGLNHAVPVAMTHCVLVIAQQPYWLSSPHYILFLRHVERISPSVAKLTSNLETNKN